MPDTRSQITSFLDKFYHNPVAIVSFELFLSIGAILFFALFAIRPTLITMSNLIKEIDDKRALDTQLAQKVAALSTAQSAYLQLQDRLYVLYEALPTGVDIAYALKVIEKAASDQGLTISSMTVLDIPAEVPLDTPINRLERKSLPIQMSVTGSYESIRGFAEQLRDSRRSFVIERITFTAENVRGLRILEASILLGAPYFGEKAGT
jgi:Tfp pilus assembly protein PilO